MALLEQLIRYGQDLEDYNNTTFGSAESTSIKSDKNDRSAGAVRTLAPRPADPEVRQQLKELKLGLDEVRDEASSARSEMDSRLDSFKVGLSALRTQFEEEMEEVKESADNDQKRFGRVEQMQKSLQAQIDVLQVKPKSIYKILNAVCIILCNKCVFKNRTKFKRWGRSYTKQSPSRKVYFYTVQSMVEYCTLHVIFHTTQLPRNKSLLLCAPCARRPSRAPPAFRFLPLFLLRWRTSRVNKVTT